MVRARSTSPGDNLTIVVTDEVDNEYSNETFCLERDYFWYYTNWFMNPMRLFIRGYIPGIAAGDVLVDSITIVPRTGIARPVAVEGQITDPYNSDTDGDRMPDGDERRNGTVWFEAEYGTGTSLTPLTSNDYSNGHAVLFTDTMPVATLSFDLSNYLATANGPMAAGNYILKVRANSSDGSGIASVQYNGASSYSKSLTISETEPTWYTMLELWIDPGDSNTALTITQSLNTFVVDKVGIVMMVDDPDKNWNYTFNSSLTYLETPAIVGDVVISTSPTMVSGPHIVGLDGTTGQVIWSDQNTSQSVTSPTAYGGSVVYAYQGGGGNIIRRVDALTGQELWSNIPVSTGVPLGQAVIDIPARVSGDLVDAQVVYGFNDLIESYNITNGQLLWTYYLPANVSFFKTIPVVYGGGRKLHPPQLYRAHA
jgi:hypothetical protein